MRKITNKMTIAAAAAVVASTVSFAAPAFAGVTIYQNGDQKLQAEGTFYLNTYAENKDSTTVGNPKTKTFGLHTDRAYITLKYHFNDDWYARFTTDMSNESSLGHKQNVYVKYAYLEGKLDGDQAVLRLGQSHTAWIDHEESLMKHRFIENTMVDKLNFDSSADLGVGLYGKLAGGMLDYFLTETNGHGYGNGAASDSMDFDSRVGIHPLPGLEIAGQFRNGYRGTKTSPVSTSAAQIESTLWQVMIDYGMSNFRIGANYLHNEDKAKTLGTAVGANNTFTSHSGNIADSFVATAIGDKVKSDGWDVWGWYNFTGTPFGVFGRYEYSENKATLGGAALANKEKYTHYVAALDYALNKDVTFALVADNTEVKNWNGTLNDNPKDQRYGLYSQVNF